MKILICGGRDYQDIAQFHQVINDFIKREGPITRIVCGGATGADEMAIQYASARGIIVHIEDAKWEKYGMAAGPKRNQHMLDVHPDISFVIAFPGGNGTADMMRRARKGRFRVVEVEKNA